VGEYMKSQMPGSRLKVIRNVGHCPHLSSPGATLDAIESFLAGL
jgi:sigma-B regulation protein RsbQ